MAALGLLALTGTLPADMMPVFPSEAGSQPSPAAGVAVDEAGMDPSGLFDWPGVRDLSLPATISLPHTQEDAAQVCETWPVQILTEGRNSFDLCLYALIGLGLCRSAPFVKKLSFGLMPDWYHSGGPFQMGHSHAIGPDLRSPPVYCFVQPDCKAPAGPPRYERGTIVSLWRKSQFTPILLTPRGPPPLSRIDSFTRVPATLL